MSYKEYELQELKKDPLSTLALLSQIFASTSIDDGNSRIKDHKIKYLIYVDGISASYDYRMGAMSCSISKRINREGKHYAYMYFGSYDDSEFSFESLEYSNPEDADAVYQKLLAVFDRLKYVPSKKEIEQISYETGCFVYGV